jgi:signal transduction histidine kinase
MLFPEELRDEESAIVRRLKAGERIVHRETVRVTKAGTRIPVSLTVSPLRDAAGNLVGVTKIARDISEQQRAREALSAVNRKLIEAQEQERARIARELHDDVGQRLALLAARLTPTQLGTPGDAITLRNEVAKIAADIQALSHHLHSPKLELLGIAPAIRRFCDEFADQHKVTVVYETDAVPRKLSADTSLCLYRILQEGLSNATKHSGVRHFEVRLWGTDTEVDLVIADRGAGFDVEAARASAGIGLISMEERIKLVAGSLSVQSAPHEGTTIHARVPLRAP